LFGWLERAIRRTQSIKETKGGKDQRLKIKFVKKVGPAGRGGGWAEKIGYGEQKEK